MHSLWTRHLKDPDEAKRFRSYIYNSKGVVDRLSDILKQKEAEQQPKELDYDCPSWAAKQADVNGYRRCVRELQELLILDLKDKE